MPKDATWFALESRARACRVLRAYYGWSVKELAERSELHPATVRKIERA